MPQPSVMNDLEGSKSEEEGPVRPKSTRYEGSLGWEGGTGREMWDAMPFQEVHWKVTDGI